MATIRPITLKSGLVTYEIQVKATDKGSGQQVTRSMRWKPEAGMTRKKADKEALVVADKFEKEFLENLTEREGVIYISNDMFLSNKNYKILASSVKVNALDYELNEIEQGIQNLLTKYCDLTVENNQDSIENLIKKLKM